MTYIRLSRASILSLKPLKSSKNNNAQHEAFETPPSILDFQNCLQLYISSIFLPSPPSHQQPRLPHPQMYQSHLLPRHSTLMLQIPVISENTLLVAQGAIFSPTFRDQKSPRWPTFSNSWFTSLISKRCDTSTSFLSGVLPSLLKETWKSMPFNDICSCSKSVKD